MLAGGGAPGVVDVVIVGCGLPGRGMGWYHALQLMDGEVAEGKLTDIVEPWFLGGGKDSDGGKAFAELVAEWEPKGVRFHSDVAGVPQPAAGVLGRLLVLRPQLVHVRVVLAIRDGRLRGADLLVELQLLPCVRLLLVAALILEHRVRLGGLLSHPVRRAVPAPALAN